MSVQRRRAKAAKRQAEYQQHGARKVFPCRRCGEPGPHFVPPSLGDIGFFLCDPPTEITQGCRECGNDLGPYDGLCLDCLEETG